MINKVYTDADRELWEPTDELIRTQLAPAMYSRKIHRSTVQSAALLAQFLYEIANKGQTRQDVKVFGAGSYEDIVVASIKATGYNVIDADPMINGLTVEQYHERHPTDEFDYVVSTSVLEHVPNDENFVRICARMLKEGGTCLMSMDFKEDWDGGRTPATSLRFYKKHDLEVRLRQIIESEGCELVGECDWSDSDTFYYDGFIYGFAGFVFKKVIRD